MVEYELTERSKQVELVDLVDSASVVEDKPTLHAQTPVNSTKVHPPKETRSIHLSIRTEQGHNIVVKELNSIILQAAKEAILKGFRRNHKSFRSNTLQVLQKTMIMARQDAESHNKWKQAIAEFQKTKLEENVKVKERKQQHCILIKKARNCGSSYSHFMKKPYHLDKLLYWRRVINC
ncbi:hypothetical protein BsWGS_16748 [Bradybaena similaris]